MPFFSLYNVRMRKKNILYFQSGGPTAVINASLSGLVKAASLNPSIGGIYGAHYGIEGVLNGDFSNLRALSESDLNLLSQTPGMYLGSSRKNLPEDLSSPIYEEIKEKLLALKIDCVFVNGGNDSMLTASKLFHYFSLRNIPISVIGIPKTIDNDLVGFDHTLGYASAALHTISLTKSIAIDGLSYKEGKVQIVETMGRDTGWLAASTDLLEEPYHPDFILVPELPIDRASFLKQLQEIYSKKKRALIVLSEGVNDHTPEEKDPFGHGNFEGAAYRWSALIKKELGLNSRVSILSSPMRSDPILASQIDIDEAYLASEAALKFFLDGKSGVMPSISRISNLPYRREFLAMPLEAVGGKVRYMPKEFLNDTHSFSKAFREYLKPLLKKRTAMVDEYGLFRSMTVLK